MTEKPVPYYKDRKFYVPAFKVSVGDSPLERDVIHDIIQVTYKDSLKDVDSFEITINNWDARTLSFKYSDKDLFDPGEKVELWMGYFNEELQLMLTGVITSLRPTFPSGGQPNLSVSGLNLLHSLRKKQESHSYQKITDNQIAKRIDKRLGVDIDTEDHGPGQTEKHKYLFQDNQYDILFLMQRARRIGYELFVIESGENGRARPSKLYFGPSVEVQQSPYELEYGRSLIEFQPNLTTANQVNKVTVRGWDAVKKRPITATASREKLDTVGVGRAGNQQRINRAFNERHEIIVDKPIHGQKEADTLAKETLERIAKDMVKGSGSVVGLPELRAGSIIYLTGLGKRFSGRYFVTGTTHTISDSGYITKFECRREDLKKNEKSKAR